MRAIKCPGNEIDNSIQNGGLFCNGKFSLFQRLAVHYQLKITRKYFEVSTEHTQNENVYCEVMQQNAFKGVCELKWCTHVKTQA